jgi:hypothetical protein
MGIVVIFSLLFLSAEFRSYTIGIGIALVLSGVVQLIPLAFLLKRKLGVATKSVRTPSRQYGDDCSYAEESFLLISQDISETDRVETL